MAMLALSYRGIYGDAVEAANGRRTAGWHRCEATGRAGDEVDLEERKNLSGASGPSSGKDIDAAIRN